MPHPPHLAGQADRLPPTHRLRTGRYGDPFPSIPKPTAEDLAHDELIDAFVRESRRQAREVAERGAALDVAA